MTQNAIIFDVDGTLIESMAVDTDLYFASLNAVLGPLRIRENLGDYDNVTDAGILLQILNDNGILAGDELVESIRAHFVHRMKDHIESAGPFDAIDGAIQMLEKVRLAGNSPVAIATGGWRDSALLKLDSAGFDLDGIPVASCDDSLSRVEIMKTALGRLGDDFDSVTYFGDAEWDRQACRDLGWKFVAVGPELGGINSYAAIDL